MYSQVEASTPLAIKLFHGIPEEVSDCYPLCFIDGNVRELTDMPEITKGI